jgi:hypothetical protein
LEIKKLHFRNFGVTQKRYTRREIMKFADDLDLLDSKIIDHGILSTPVIRQARGLSELQDVYRLTHDCYVASGYCEPSPSGLFIHYPHFDHIPETKIFIAILRGKIVGSLSLTFDGPTGFPIEKDFKQECDAIRAEGYPVATVWRMVIETSVRTDRAVVVALMNEITATIVRHNVQTALMSVNPKHVSVYQRMLNASIVAQHSSTEGLDGAPATLLRSSPVELPEKSVLYRVPGPNPLRELLQKSDF